MPTLEINLLGDLKIVHNDVVITSQLPLKSQALLAYLAATRQKHSRHALAGLFWGDRTEEKAKNSLRVAINGLRKLIPDHLAITRQTLGLIWDSGLLLDTGQLAELGRDYKGEGVERLFQATSAYRGDFLEGLTLTDAPEFDEWLEQQRSYWRRLALRSLADLAQQCLASEEYDQALRVLNRHLEIDPCSEEAYRRTMTAYSRKGEIGAALEQYRRCEEALAAILNVRPSSETVAIYHSLESAGQRPAKVVHTNTSRGKLIGRAQELEKLQNLLNNPFSRLITIAGFGGIGKTQLVQTIVAEILERETLQFLHGVFLIPLASVESASLLATSTIDALKLEVPGIRNPTDELIESLGGKEMLLIFDGFELFLDSGIEFITRILTECPKVKIVVTSREWLNVGMEWRLNLEGLAYPDTWTDLNISAVTEYPAIQYFLQEARRARPGFQPAENDRGPLCRLCKLVAGIPLALMLAATWLRTMSIEDIADEVERDMDILTSRIRNMPSRQRSMRVVFESTWSQLLPDEQKMFRSLSVFRGGFTLEAVANLLYADSDGSSALEGLDALADKGLIQYNDDQDRYYVHELLRQCGADKLSADPHEKESIQKKHSYYYCDQLMQLEDLCKGSQQLKALATYVADSENFHAAWLTAARNQHVESIANAMDCLGLLLEWRSRAGDALHLLETSSQILRARSIMQPEPLLLTTFARTLLWIANFYRLSGRPEAAVASLDQCERLLNEEKLNDPLVSAFYSLQRGHLVLDVENEIAHEWYQKSLSLFRALERKWETAVVLEALGLVNQSMGDLSAAESFIQESLSIRQQLGDQRGMANALAVLSSVTRFQGDIQTAVRYARESSELYQAMDDRASMADGLQNLGMTLNSVGEYEEAMKLLEVSMEIYRDLNSQRRLSSVHANASHVAGCLGQFDRASYHASETIRLGEESNDLRSVANGYTLLAWHAVVAGQFEQALTLLEKGHAISSRARGHAEEDIALSVWGYAFDGLNRHQEARAVFVSLLQKCTLERDFLPLVTAVPKVALMLLVQAPTLQPQAKRETWQRRAVTAYTAIKRWPVVGTSKLLDTIVTHALQEQLSLLPAPFVNSVQLSAQSTDIWEVVSELAEELPAIGWTLIDLERITAFAEGV